MMTPVRLQLSRRKGFVLRHVSLSINGLDAVNCARPGRWGNPYKIGDLIERDGRRFPVGSAAHARTLFLECVLGHYLRVAALSKGPDDRRRGVLGAQQWIEEASSLRGKNLACWCSIDQPCHADLLMGFANNYTCEAV